MQIADEIGVSRFRVARMLEQARERGIVHIEVEAPPGVDLDASVGWPTATACARRWC